MKPTDEERQMIRDLTANLDDVTAHERMTAHGFWPDGVPIPRDPPDEAAERAALKSEVERLAALRADGRDASAALAEERKRRWDESKKRRALRAAERRAAQLARSEAWQVRRDATMVHAGEGVSAGLSRPATTLDEQKLEARGLPILRDAPSVAGAIGMPLSTLRWLTFHRRGATLVHYHRYGIPKKTGGTRAISAPKPDLARAQRWVFEEILSRVQTTPVAHGFVAGRSVLTNAEPHQRRAVVVNIDLRDFWLSSRFGGSVTGHRRSGISAGTG